MVLTKEELISALQQEVRILSHLAGKVDKSKLDYRPTATQRTTLELLQYMAIMGPTLLAVFQTGRFDRETLGAIFGPASAKSKAMDYDQAVAAIQNQSTEYMRVLSDWTDPDFRAEIDMFGNKTTRGALIVNLVLGGHAAYRTQLFCYLKACGRDELNTMNLWSGVDGPV
jgi:hypothetical protein